MLSNYYNNMKSLIKKGLVLYINLQAEGDEPIAKVGWIWITLFFIGNYPLFKEGLIIISNSF